MCYHFRLSTVCTRVLVVWKYQTTFLFRPSSSSIFRQLSNVGEPKHYQEDSVKMNYCPFGKVFIYFKAWHGMAIRYFVLLCIYWSRCCHWSWCMATHVFLPSFWYFLLEATTSCGDRKGISWEPEETVLNNSQIADDLRRNDANAMSF